MIAYIRRLENMDPIPAEDGGDDYYLNGSYAKLKDAGASYGLNQVAVREKQQSEEPKEEEEEEPDVEKESKNHAARHEERKAQRKSQAAQKRR